MEKIDYLLFEPIDVPPINGANSFIRADIERPTLMMGRGPELYGVVSVWLDSIDTRSAVDAVLPGAHAYLVTESVAQPITGDALVHFTWFPKPERLSDEEFFRGWHDVHTPSTFALHPNRTGYVRDSVFRALTPGAPRVDAIVFEYFPTIEDYTDPKRLFGSREALEETSRHLPMFADQDSINSCPLVRVGATGSRSERPTP